MRYILSVLLLAITLSPAFGQNRSRERGYERNRHPEVRQVYRQSNRVVVRPRLEVRLGGLFGYDNTEQVRAYHTGFNAGRYDRNFYKRYQPYRALNAQGYNSSVYRQAFIEGYEAGYRSY
jgi:hypothetical protein